MPHRSIIYGSIIVLSVFVVVLGWVAWFLSRPQDLRITFFDVGQGDGILITEGPFQVLIDSGRSGQTILSRLGQAVPFWDRTIDVVIPTHPDQDHIGGLRDVLGAYRVPVVLSTQATSTSKTFAAWQEALAQEHAENVEAFSGVAVQFPSGARLDVVHPFGSVANNGEDTNQTSIAVVLTREGETFFFGGDLPSAQEDILPIGSIDVLKVGHHGSASSTSERFLEKITPREAIISVGENNFYGHPTSVVLERLARSGIITYRTDQRGTITYVCPHDQRSCVVHADR